MAVSPVDQRITSYQNPYTITGVAHIAADNNRIGKLSISMCPGKQDKIWDRDLELDLKAIKEQGVEIIVCLLEWSELSTLGVSNYPMRAQEEGFLFYHLPIKDRRAPSDKEVAGLVPIIVDHMLNGQNILIHCRAGLGRAGTICACCLAHFGFVGEAAINLVRSRRPGAIQTFDQAYCIINYCSQVV